MKKLLIAALTFVLGSFGYAIVDATLENRVNNLEASYIALSEQFDNYIATNTTTTRNSADSDDDSNYYPEFDISPTPIPRPEATYFDKYVKSVLNSGNYTATVKGNFQGYSATVNIYKNGGTAYNISTVYHSVPVSYRYFYSDGSVYIIVPSVLSYAVVDETDPVIKKLENIASQATALLTNNEMTCLGVSSGAGYVCESYENIEGTTFNYYFNEGGLKKIETSDSFSNISIFNVSLKSEVSASGIFSVPSGYKKVDVQYFIDRMPQP